MQLYIAWPSWLDTEQKRGRLFWMSLLLTNLIAIISLWWTGSSHYYIANPAGGNMWIAIGRLTGLLLEFVILFQLILIARISPIEKVFPYDRMNKLHRWIGYSLLALLLAHPILLSIGYSTVNGTTPLTQTASFLAEWEDVWNAFIGTILFLYASILSIPVIRKKLRYELWHGTHLLMYLAIALSFGHQISSGDVTRGGALKYWLALNFSVFGVLLFFRFIKPVTKFLDISFRVSKVIKETADTHSVYLTGRSIERFHFAPGQFANISFLQKGMWSIHPFSFSQEENGETLRFTMKELGDHTKQLGTLRPGTHVLIDGPHGYFTLERAMRKKILLIAGGIGVTPLRAMAGALEGSGKSATLLYGVRTVADIAFRSEFDALNERGVCAVHYIVSTPTEGYESGYLDQEKLLRLVPDFPERDIFICGPAPMMDATIALLRKLGVTQDHLHFEKFSM